ncbi:glycosyltransferase family 2 protein [Winogradskyella luteola]|uniref:Glycosyltransferase n=1 Tax=Winogradskyella luteola TaxID=2828330 RepID=A0A9X1F8G5_9FLAO|nr:glycosyltransferase [Winogradskyella luteola]MBV7268543.1 glycosyltransferase [Winogradskyella luteola]
MNSKYTIIFAYRNRDSERVKLSLESLSKQTNLNFEVIFVDYGSDENYAKEIYTVVNSFRFVLYHYISHSGLLWNKSKALNYGISNAKNEYILLADVDVLFASNFVETLNDYKDSDSFTLFKINYLAQAVQSSDIIEKPLDKLKISHSGDTFGIGLFPKKALERVRGLDTFFHFYGSEDEDLNSRLETAGYKQKRCNVPLLWHQWHPTYNTEKEILTINPRLSNVRRINQRHFLWQKEERTIIPSDSENWGKVFFKTDLDILNRPTSSVTIVNIEAHVIHFLRLILPSLTNHVVKVVFLQDDYYKSLKYKLKHTLNKESQRYISIKQVNDLILEEIIFKYKDYNYKYEVAKNLETIIFTIDLNSN